MAETVESFDADWLSLREPADAAARSRGLAGILTDRFAGRDEISIVDLGAGTGSAMRWLAPRLPVAQRWLLVDGDHRLLQRAGKSAPPGVSSIRTAKANLADADLSEFLGGADLVTASALLDLVSSPWIDRLVDACVKAGTASWLTLSVNGVDAWYPPLRGDWAAGRAFAKDQSRDKGFGPSLGPKAARYASDAFRRAGFEVRIDQSDWRLSPTGGIAAIELQQELLRGHAAAAMAAEPSRGRFYEAWAHRRLLKIASGRGGARIGHLDVLALPR